MFKILILMICFFLPLSQALSKVEVRWFTVAAILLEDDETQIFFDPMFTRADLSHWLKLSQLKSNETLVSGIIKEHGLDKIQALFASHSHYDHSIDAPIVAKLTGATFYVDESSERIAKAYKDPAIKTVRFENLKPIKVGKFTITPIKRVHSPIRLIDFEFLPGPVPVNFNFDFYDYHVGDTWLYFIDHPEGKILLDQGSEPYIEKLKPFTKDAGVVIQGIANRKSDEAIIEGYVKHLNPQMFIPLHFDNFFFGFDPKSEMSYLPGINIKGMMEKLKKTYPAKKVLEPRYGEKITLF